MHLPRPLSRLKTGTVILALLASACAGGEPAVDDRVPAGSAPATVTTDPSSPPVSAIDKANLEEDPQRIADLLEDPERAEEGALAMLGLLGIGVYTIEGDLVMAGSERGEADLWVYDADLATLAEMAGQPGPGWEELHGFVASLLDVRSDSMAMLEMFREAVAAYPDEPMSRLLAVRAIGFDEVPELSRLDAWLLLVSLLPDPGAAVSAAGAPGLLGSGRGLLHQALDVTCAGKVGGDGSSAGWGIVGKYADEVVGPLEDLTLEAILASEVLGAGAKMAAEVRVLLKGVSKLGGTAVAVLIDAIKLGLIWGKVEIDVTTDRGPLTHQFHDAKGETVEDWQFDVIVEARWGGFRVAEKDAILCGILDRLGYPPADAPLENVGVEFIADEFLIEKGYLRFEDTTESIIRQLTDPAGRARVTYQPKPERPAAAQDLGNEAIVRESGKITMEFDFVAAFEEFFNTVASAELVLDLFDVGNEEFEVFVEWHEPVWEIAGSAGLPGGASVRISGSFRPGDDGSIVGEAELQYVGRCFDMTPVPMPIGGTSGDAGFLLNFTPDLEATPEISPKGCSSEDVLAETFGPALGLSAVQAALSFSGGVSIASEDGASATVSAEMGDLFGGLGDQQEFTEVVLEMVITPKAG